MSSLMEFLILKKSDGETAVVMNRTCAKMVLNQVLKSRTKCKALNRYLRLTARFFSKRYLELSV